MRETTTEAQGVYRRLIEALERAGLPTNQVWIGKQLGVYQSAVAKWKAGEGYPSIPNLVRLSQIANCSVGYLLTGKESLRDNKMDDLTNALLSAWDSLPESIRKEVLAFAEFKTATLPDKPQAPAEKPE